MRTTIDLSGPLLQNAKKVAAERGVTLSAVVEDALRGHLAQRRPDSSARFPLHTVRGTLLQPDLNLDRTSALLAMDDESNYQQGRKG